MRTSPSPKFEEFITITEAARLSKTSRPTIYRLIEEGSLKAVSFTPDKRLGKRNNWRIPLSAWKEYVEG